MAEDKPTILAPFQITPKQYAQETEFAPLNEPLGAIAFAFADLEDKLTFAINRLLGIEHIPDGIILEDLMQSFTGRRKLFCALVSLKTKGDLKVEVEKKGGLGSSLMFCNTIRNDLLHGRWTGWNSEKESFQKVRYHAEPTGLHLVESTLDLTIPDLWKHHATIFQTTLDLATWTAVFNYQDRPDLWPPSWRGKSAR